LFDVRFRHKMFVFGIGHGFAWQGLPRLAAQVGRGLFCKLLSPPPDNFLMALSFLYECALFIVRKMFYMVYLP
jgi:hypothetical protein